MSAFRSIVMLGLTLVFGTISLAGQEPAAVTRICLAPSSVEAGSSNANAAMDATRENFLSYLTGPTLKAEALKSRLESQVKEEAKQAGCPFVLFTTVKLVSKRGRRADPAYRQAARPALRPQAGADGDRAEPRGAQGSPRERRLTLEVAVPRNWG